MSSVKVALRIRSLVTREMAYACTECLRTVDGQQVILGKDKAFTFDYVFSPTSPQVEVYETSVQPLLSSLFNGYNATVLAYGQTGSGKTYTMGSGYAALCSATASLNQGENQNFHIENFDEVGIIPRVLNQLFQNIDEEPNKDIKFSVKVSFVEIYNEEIKDLFNLKPLSGGTAEPLNIREENNTIRVVNLSEICVTNAPTTIQLLKKGSSMRVVGGTAMNDQSSRSHAIFTITLEQSRGTNDLIKSKFHLVDLAGSERQSKTKAEGIRLREGININLGLLALGNVISILGEDNPSNKARHVPYRESKLTRILQDSLGGNSHTVMIACASPADSNMEETLNTLRYADRARKIKNKPVVNIDPQMAEICSLRQQLQELKTQIFQLTGGVNIRKDFCIEDASELSNIKKENERLKAENLKSLERIIQLEQEKDDFKKKFDEIKSTLEKISQENNNIGPDVSLEASVIHANNSKLLINELQSKLGEFEHKENSKLIGEEEMNCEEESSNEEHALRTEFDKELKRKKSLHQKMLEKENEELHEMLRSVDRNQDNKAPRAKRKLQDDENDFQMSGDDDDDNDEAPAHKKKCTQNADVASSASYEAILTSEKLPTESVTNEPVKTVSESCEPSTSDGRNSKSTSRLNKQDLFDYNPITNYFYYNKNRAVSKLVDEKYLNEDEFVKAAFQKHNLKICSVPLVDCMKTALFKDLKLPIIITSKMKEELKMPDTSKSRETELSATTAKTTKKDKSKKILSNDEKAEQHKRSNRTFNSGRRKQKSLRGIKEKLDLENEDAEKTIDLDVTTNSATNNSDLNSKETTENGTETATISEIDTETVASSDIISIQSGLNGKNEKSGKMKRSSDGKFVNNNKEEESQSPLTDKMDFYEVEVEEVGSESGKQLKNSKITQTILL